MRGSPAMPAHASSAAAAAPRPRISLRCARPSNPISPAAILAWPRSPSAWASSPPAPKVAPPPLPKPPPVPAAPAAAAATQRSSLAPRAAQGAGAPTLLVIRIELAGLSARFDHAPDRLVLRDDEDVIE